MQKDLPGGSSFLKLKQLALQRLQDFYFRLWALARMQGAFYMAKRGQMKQAVQTNAGHVSLSEAFHALQVLTMCRPFTGLDEWRQQAGGAGHGVFDPALAAMLAKQPPSKAGTLAQPSLWTALHFSIALPVLFWTIRKYSEDPLTAGLQLSEERAARSFPAFMPIAAHYVEHRRLAGTVGTAPDAAAWRALLDRHIQFPITSVGEALQALPSPLQKAAKDAVQGDVSLAGRIVLAYLVEHGVAAAALGIDNRVKPYIEPIGDGPRQSFFERLCAAYAELPQLAPFLDDYDGCSVRLDAFLGLVSWYGRPHVVEMVVPNMSGAAAHAARALIALFKELVAEGSPDYTRPPTAELASVEKFRETQSLEAIGRLSFVEDLLYDAAHDKHAGGMVLRRLVTNMYPEEERQAAWGNAERYVPDVRRTGFATFRQDVGNILYAMGLLEQSDEGRSRRLADAAWRVQSAATVFEIRTLVQMARVTVSETFENWRKRYASHERLRILRWLQHAFGLERLPLAPVPFEELALSFAGSTRGDSFYTVRLREAEDEGSWRVPLPALAHPLARVRYHTLAMGEVRTSAEGLPFAAWLSITSPKGTVEVPVPARGSFELFGRPGSAHAGEVVGFGCSVHHAALAVLLAELTALGAAQGELRQLLRSVMSLNDGVHERLDLADFQLEEIVTAVHQGRLLSYADYLRERPQLCEDASRPHLQTYTAGGPVSTAWAEPAAARLLFICPALYDAADAPPRPRASWYDGRDARLAPATPFTWQCVYKDAEGVLA